MPEIRPRWFSTEMGEMRVAPGHLGGRPNDSPSGAALGSMVSTARLRERTPGMIVIE
jgi:hypothetical protein